MSQLLRQANLLFCRTPILQSQRFRGKINIQRPRAPHYERARMLAVVETASMLERKKEEVKKSTCFQRRHSQAEEKNPYMEIIAREVRNWLQHSRMIGFYHLNSIKQEDLFPVRVQLHKQNMHLKAYGKEIVRKAVVGTHYEAILPLFESKTCVVFSTEQQVEPLLRITRKVPQMVLLAGIVDERLLSRNEFMAYGQLAGIQEAQGELVTVLNMAAGNMVQVLETHQKNFVNVLDVHAKGASTTGQAKTGDSADGQGHGVN